MIKENWTLTQPTTCNLTKPGMFDIKTYQYNGPRINAAQLQMPIKPNPSIAKGLASLKSTLPSSFSWRNHTGVESARNQGACGSCWAFSVSTSLGDRYAIKNNVAAPYPSTAWLVTTAKPPNVSADEECNTGGNTAYAAQWLEQDGNFLKLEQCFPYSIIRDHSWVSPESLLSTIPDDCCINCCGSQIEDISSVKFSVEPGSTQYIAVESSTSSSGFDNTGTIIAIKNDLMNNGPLTTSFDVYSDFNNYWNTLTNLSSSQKETYVYTYDGTSSYEGGHAVVITGWGVLSSGVEYWEIRNSWGSEGGDNGYCKIAMSTSIPNMSQWIGIDIPLIYQGYYYGGVVSFTPQLAANSSIPQTNITESNTTSPPETGLVTTYSPIGGSITTTSPPVSDGVFNLFNSTGKYIVGIISIILFLLLFLL